MLYFNERFSMGYFCCYFSTCFREKSRYHNFGKQNSICFLAVLGNIMLFDSDWLCYFCDSIPCRKLDTLLAETASHINQQILYEPMDFKMQEKEGRQIDSFIKLKNLHLNRLNCDKLYIFY